MPSVFSNNRLILLTVYFLFFLCLFSCDSIDERPIDTRKMAQSIRDRKPQRITEKDLLEWVKRKGNQWSFLAQKDLYRQIKKGLADSTLKRIEDFDTLPTLPVIDSIAQIYLIDIQTYSFNRKNELASEIKNLLASYQEKQASQEPIVREALDKQRIFYTSPIVIENTVIGAWFITFPIKSARSRYDYKDLR